ncbi:hypothetical protein HDU92_001246 [Lobulomyces angularis]|nr:hypothetical protein HDU92_001246 [Lobulomyces angularis]
MSSINELHDATQDYYSMENQLLRIYTFHTLITSYILFIIYILSILVVEILKYNARNLEDAHYSSNTIKEMLFSHPVQKNNDALLSERPVILYVEDNEKGKEALTEEPVSGDLEHLLSKKNIISEETKESVQRHSFYRIVEDFKEPTPEANDENPDLTLRHTNTLQTTIDESDDENWHDEKLLKMEKYDNYKEIWQNVFIIYISTVFLSFAGIFLFSKRSI